MDGDPEHQTRYPLNRQLLITPRVGDPITVSGHFAYVRRASAENQARAWNDVLAGDPIHGTVTGCVVGVSPLRNTEHRYELVTACSGFPALTDLITDLVTVTAHRLQP